MDSDTEVYRYIDSIYTYSQKFMEKEYPDEAPYFDIAWEIFEEILRGGKDSSNTLDLKGPMVRLEGGDTIMAPLVIKAFYTLFRELGEEIESGKPGILASAKQILSEHKFPSEFSEKALDFILTYKND